jgi:hypothetical protein
MIQSKKTKRKNKEMNRSPKKNKHAIESWLWEATPKQALTDRMIERTVNKENDQMRNRWETINKIRTLVVE